MIISFYTKPGLVLYYKTIQPAVCATSSPIGKLLIKFSLSHEWLPVFQNQKGIINSANMQASSLISRFWRYLLAILIVAGVTAIFYILRDVLLDTTLVALLYLDSPGRHHGLLGAWTRYYFRISGFLRAQLFFYPALLHPDGSPAGGCCDPGCLSDRCGCYQPLVVDVPRRDWLRQQHASVKLHNSMSSAQHLLACRMSGHRADPSKQVHAVAEGECAKLMSPADRSLNFRSPDMKPLFVHRN